MNLLPWQQWWHRYLVGGLGILGGLWLITIGGIGWAIQSIQQQVARLERQLISQHTQESRREPPLTVDEQHVSAVGGVELDWIFNRIIDQTPQTLHLERLQYDHNHGVRIEGSSGVYQEIEKFYHYVNNQDLCRPVSWSVRKKEGRYHSVITCYLNK